MLGIYATNTNKAKGFTLIEMSIVLVIIGLIIGGILKGQEIIESSRQKNVITQVDAVRSSVNTFADRYNALPGDYGAAASRVSELLSAATTTGNDDGLIGATVATSALLQTTDGDEDERIQFFNHLSAAELLAGSQVNGNTTNFGDGGILPATAIPGTGMTVIHGLDNRTFSARRAHWLRIHKNVGGGVTGSTDGAIAGRRLAEMDLKVDDGNPAIGTVRVMADEGDCATAGTGYSVSAGSTTCVPFFELLQ